MRGKLILIAGVAVGYVLGSRAGRERYDQIAKAASRFWQSPSVQRQVHQVEDFAKDKAPEVVDFVSGNVKKISRGSSRTASPSTTRRTAASKGRATKAPTTAADDETSTD